MLENFIAIDFTRNFLKLFINTKQFLGYPGAPSSIKITKGQDCARLNWAPPSTPNGTICEYSVYLAMRTADVGSPFLRVYAGAEPSCTVSNKTLTSALIDSTPKPAVIFRIAARNEKVCFIQIGWVFKIQ